MRAFSQFGSGNRNFGQPAARLADEVGKLENVVVIGTKNGQPWVGSTLDETKAANLIEQHIPQEA